MARNLPSIESLSYRDVSQKLVTRTIDDAAVSVVLDRLIRLGEVVEDHTQAGFPADSIDPSGALVGLDDDELSDWWTGGCWVREFVWQAAAEGHAAAVDWTSLMICFAERGSTFDFRRELALDLRDLSRLVTRAHDDNRMTGQSGPGPVGIVSRWNRQRLDHTGAPSMASEGQKSIVWRAWVDGREVEAGNEFDALIQGVIARSATLVVEFEDSPRRHVLLPIGPTDETLVDTAFYCIDLIRCCGGWLTPAGEWTWEDADDHDGSAAVAG